MASGFVVSYRSFKYGKRFAKVIVEAEYLRVIEFLREDGFGYIVEFSILRARGKWKVFVKLILEFWLNIIFISNIEFRNVLVKLIYSGIFVFMWVYL